MLGFNLYVAERLAEECRKDAMREAERTRLIQAVNSSRPGLPHRVLARTGSFLISAGKKLQARSAPVQTAVAASPSRCEPMTKPY